VTDFGRGCRKRLITFLKTTVQSDDGETNKPSRFADELDPSHQRSEGAMKLSWVLQNATISTTLTLTMISFSPLAAARGGISHTEVASTRHIEELPPEIRNALGRWQSACGTPLKARPLFAHYLGDSAVGYRLIALHFHELDCANRAALCGNQGCLHQVYISTDGAYRLAFSANVPEVTLTLIDHTPEIEIGGETFSWQSPRLLRWNGRGFVEN
jgi:hypothetical protein